MSASIDSSTLPAPRSGMRLAYLHRAAEPAGDLAARLTRLALEVERAGFDFLLFDDEPKAGGPVPAARLDPFTAASFVATRTRHLGLAVTADAAYYEPFNLARLTASLDHITHGRAALNLTLDPARSAAANFGVRHRAAPEDGQRHAEEFLHIVRSLWDSWEDDAFIRDKETGRFVDGTKIHAIAHRGEHFQVQGPLNVARPPQGQLPLVHVERSAATREWAATEADVVIVAEPDEAGARSARAALRLGAADGGRDADALAVLARVVPLVGTSPSEAADLHARWAPLLPAGIVVAGTAGEVADRLHGWVEQGVADGYAVLPAPVAGQWPRFAEAVLPELARRGAIGPAPGVGATLRERLGLARPANRHAAAPTLSGQTT